MTLKNITYSNRMYRLNEKGIYKMTYTITKNAEFNSLEIYFDGKPSEAIRTALKELRFRWHSVKKCWYGYTTEESARAAISGESEAPTATPAEKKKPAAKAIKAPAHGVKVGDLFYTSWGYEQTNVNFFQVIALVGSSSVRVREVYPEMIEEDEFSGMSAKRRYKLPEAGEILPPATHASFIEDNENGDLLRVNTKYGAPLIKVGKPNHYQESARPYSGDFLYESWYY